MPFPTESYLSNNDSTAGGTLLLGGTAHNGLSDYELERLLRALSEEFNSARSVQLQGQPSTDKNDMLSEGPADNKSPDDELERFFEEFLQESNPGAAPQLPESTDENDHFSPRTSLELLATPDQMTGVSDQQDGEALTSLRQSHVMNGHMTLAPTCLENHNAHSGSLQQGGNVPIDLSGSLSGLSFVVPSMSFGGHGTEGWADLRGANNNQSQAGYRGCAGQIGLPPSADTRSNSYIAVETSAAAKSREVSVRYSSKLDGMTKRTASSRSLSTVLQPATKKAPVKRAHTSVRLFALSLVLHLRSRDLFVFKFADNGAKGRYDMLLVVGDDKLVLARDRIEDLVLVPPISESNSSCLRQTLRQIIVKAEAVHQIHYALGQTSTGAAIVNPNYLSKCANMTAKYNFLKGIAFLLTRHAGLDGSGRSIWAPLNTDRTSECWNRRITQLQLKAKEIFVEIVFPPRPSES